MNAPRWNFLFLAAVAAASPALGQDVASPVGPANSGTHNAASIPNFSGIWGNPYLWAFEPPLSGPGPVVNKSRKNGVSNQNQLVGDYTNPILKPHAAEVVKKHGEIELSGVASPTPSNQCWPEPLPYIFFNHGIQLLQLPDKIIIIYDEDHEFRQVPMNQSHPAQVTPSWYGDSVGHYEGEMLVIDTVGIKTDRAFAMVDSFGTPYTQALHVVERYRMLDYEAAKEAQERSGRENFRLPGAAEGWAPDPNYKGNGLQLQFTADDEGVFTIPWSATITYRRPLLGEWPEIVCADNTFEYYAGKDSAVPRAEKPDF